MPRRFLLRWLIEPISIRRGYDVGGIKNATQYGLTIEREAFVTSTQSLGRVADRKNFGARSRCKALSAARGYKNGCSIHKAVHLYNNLQQQTNLPATATTLNLSLAHKFSSVSTHNNNGYRIRIYALLQPRAPQRSTRRASPAAQGPQEIHPKVPAAR